MKKITCVLTIIAIVSVMLCFAACGNEKVQDEVTSMENDVTSMIDEVTSMGEDIAQDLTENGNVTNETSENMLESFVEDMTDETDLSDEAAKNTSESGKTE